MLNYTFSKLNFKNKSIIKKKYLNGFDEILEILGTKLMRSISTAKI
jgi:hypothetical protein